MTPYQKIAVDVLTQAVFAAYQVRARESVSDWFLIDPVDRGQWREAVIKAVAQVLDAGDRDPEILGQVLFRVFRRVGARISVLAWDELPAAARENWIGAARYVIEVLTLP